jgi:serine/threonine protein phosphatase PrpC
LPLRVVEKAALSDVGRARQGNEDSYLERSPLFAVADGMGGARAGEVASGIAVSTFDEEPQPEASPEERLAAVATAANQRIYSLAQEDASYAGMGTTFTAVLVTGNEIAIGHVGDSRLYRWRDGELERLTDDHSLVEEFVRQGKLTPEEAEVHPQRSIITRALGPEPQVEVDTLTYPARAGDVYLACSDGLTGMISEGVVAEILRDSQTLDEAAQALIDAANQNGGRDNITVVLFRLDEDPDGADDSDTLGDSATQVGISADEVRAAVAAEEGRGTARTVQREVPAEGEQTMHLKGREATRARRQVQIGADRPSDPGVGAPARPPPVPRGRGGRRTSRRVLGLLLTLVIVGALVVGIYAGSRQFYFVGTDDSGLVTMYRGLPYALPLGIDLYSEQYVSPVPARTLPAGARKRIIDHSLRSKGDARDLVQQVEQGRIQN